MTIPTHELADALDDLSHDLGKYIVLPLAFLPQDSNDEQLRDALRRCLLETRRTQTSVTSAAQIYDEFAQQYRSELETLDSWTTLERAMKNAFALLELVHDTSAVLERTQIEANLRAVGDAIRTLETELNNV